LGHFCQKICVRKINKIPEFYMIIARKIFSRILWPDERSSLPPVSYANAKAVYGTKKVSNQIKS